MLSIVHESNWVTVTLWPSPSHISSPQDFPHTTHPQYLHREKFHCCWSACVGHRTYDKTLTTDYVSENWKHLCSGVNWPRHILTVSCFVCALEILLLTYLLTYSIAIYVCIETWAIGLLSWNHAIEALSYRRKTHIAISLWSIISLH